MPPPRSPDQLDARFVVRRSAGGAAGFELGLEVGGRAWTWRVPREPSLDPAVKRLALRVADRPLAPSAAATAAADDDDAWDAGS